jgi:ubiquitin carboxyl-terminal hydrolase 8
MDIMNTNESQRGLSGLTNLGNTCYLNAAVQILSHIHELNEYLMNVKQLNRINDSVLTIEWISLYKLIWSQNCIISPNRFVSKIKELSLSQSNTTKFCNFEQNDSNEYFYFMLDCIHNSLNKLDQSDRIKLNKTSNPELNKEIDAYETKDCSIVHSLFTSFLTYTYVNKETNVVEFTKHEPHFMIELSIPLVNNISIEDCIKHTFQEETLDTLWHDEKTNEKKQLIKRTEFGYYPTILVVHFKRWIKMNKNRQIVHFNETLHLDETYELFGIINHEGNMFGGHYYSYIKKNKWFVFNDTHISQIQMQEIVGDKNYCLFYRKIK